MANTFTIVYRSSGEAGAFNDGNPITWNAERVDEDGAYNAVTPTGNVIVPAGKLYVRCASQIAGPTRADAMGNRIYIHKNASAAYHGVAQHVENHDIVGLSGYSNTEFGCRGPIIPVSEGDTISTVAYSTEGNNMGTFLTPRTYLSVEFFDAEPSACLVGTGSGGYTLPSGNFSTFKTLSWATEVYDNLTAYNASQPTRLTVPAGVNYVRLMGQASLPDQTGLACGMWLRIKKNGSAMTGPTAEFRQDDTSGQYDQKSLHIESSVVPVVEGDYFELELQTETTENSVQEYASWFFMEAFA